jgi:hypothetical protein
MRNKISILQHKLNEYQLKKDESLVDVDWTLIKEIIFIIADIVTVISHDLPDKYKWLSSMLLMIAEVLKSVCGEIKPKEN